MRLANPAACSLFNQKVSELVKHHFGMPVVSGETAEIEIIRSGGEVGVGEMTVAQTEWEGEEVYIVYLRDITERYQAEVSLQESQNLMQRIAESSPSIFYIYDLVEQRNIYINRPVVRNPGLFFRRNSGNGFSFDAYSTSP